MNNELSVKELSLRMDPRLKGRSIMVTMDSTVLVMLDGHWHVLNDDFSVKIDLAPYSKGPVGSNPTPVGEKHDPYEGGFDGWRNR